MIEDWNKLANLLREQTPFAFSKMNDGEMNTVVKNNVSISRGAQEYNEGLANLLLEALCHKQTNYFVGIPCEKCYPFLHQKAKQLSGCTMLANTLINGNFNLTLDLLTEQLKNRRVVFVCNEEAKVDNLPSSIKPYMIVKVPISNSWNAYSKLQNLYKACTGGDVVLFCCGPLGRVLAYKWFSEMPSLTCIELGSFFDPWTNGKMYGYHTGILRACTTCNSSARTSHSFCVPEDIVSKCSYVERFYYGDVTLQYILSLYANDKNAALRYYKAAKFSSESTRHAWYYHWMIAQLSLDLGLVSSSKDTFIDTTIKELIEIDSEPIDATYNLALQLTNKSHSISWLLQCTNKVDFSKVQNKFLLNENIYNFQLLDQLVIDCYYARLYYHSYLSWTLLMRQIHKVPEWQQQRCIENGRYATFMLEYHAKDDVDRFAYENCLCKLFDGSALYFLDTRGGDGSSTRFFEKNLNWQGIVLESDTDKFASLLYHCKAQVIQPSTPRYKLSEVFQYTVIDKFDVVFLDATEDGWYILDNFDFDIHTVAWVVRNTDSNQQASSNIDKRLKQHRFYLSHKNDKHAVYLNEDFVNVGFSSSLNKGLQVLKGALQL